MEFITAVPTSGTAASASINTVTITSLPGPKVTYSVVQARHSIYIAGKALEQTARSTACRTALKFGIFVHSRRPKVSAEQIATRIQSSGLPCSSHEPDVAIAVGGGVTFE